jgi:hypothetical protein
LKALATLALVSVVPLHAGSAAPPESALRALAARSIGPAVMGGRVSDIALDPKDPSTYYVAMATGGLVKTTDGGATFDFVFEREAAASTGAVAVAPSDPKVVWLGTGEANDRNSSGWGNGVYLSKDAGGTWTHVGLDASRAIARIVVHPGDPATAYVAAVGDLWVPRAGRGLFKTTDSGRTWKAVLVAQGSDVERAGCGDVVMDPGNPAVLYAALYARRRTPWSFVSGPEATDGRDVGGIFKTEDGGATWRKLGGGLPTRTRHRPRDPCEGPEDRLRDRGERGGRGEQHRRPLQQARGSVPLGGFRSDVEAGQPPQPPSVLLQPDPGRPRGGQAGLRPGLRPPRLGGRRIELP